MSTLFETLTTERLILRPLSPDDAAELFVVFSDAETMRFWVDLPHKDVEQTRQQIMNLVSYPNARQWAVVLKDEGRAAGVFGYLGNEGVPGIGYILRRDLWRQGIATEALRAIVAHGFDVLGFDRVELWIHEDNVASQRLALKTGFVAVSQFHMKWPQFDEPHVMRIYGLKATQFAPAKHTADAAVSINRVVPILVVPDVRATTEFYRDSLGFTIEFIMGEPANYAGLSRGDWTFPSARLHLSLGAGSPDAVQLFFFVGPGLDRLHGELRAAGVEIVSPPENKSWGMREFTARDLNGCLLRFGMPA